MHKHGSAYPKPRAKGELIKHLEQSHADKIRVKLIEVRWTRVELEITHDTIHQGESV